MEDKDKVVTMINSQTEKFAEAALKHNQFVQKVINALTEVQGIAEQYCIPDEQFKETEILINALNSLLADAAVLVGEVKND